MNRRTFFQGIAAGLVAFAARPIFSWAGFDPSQKYGNFVVWSGRSGDWRDAREIVLRNAREVLPAGTEFVFRVKTPRSGGGTVDPFDEIATAAWQYPAPSDVRRLWNGKVSGLSCERCGGSLVISELVIA